MRTATIRRETKETRIQGRLKIDGRGQYDVSTGVRFLDHMLELFARHGGFDLKLKATGDLDVDQHHTVEDTGIVLGGRPRSWGSGAPRWPIGKCPCDGCGRASRPVG